MRGDRPCSSSHDATMPVAAPHARGSTQSERWYLRWLTGCPACAGIDPSRAGRRTRSNWLPRMRGDRPARASTCSASSGAAPHARGSTLVINRGARIDGGCPACAGIDPMIKGAATQAERLPRMRGDRPAWTVGIEIVQEAAPHARGSTR